MALRESLRLKDACHGGVLAAAAARCLPGVCQVSSGLLAFCYVSHCELDRLKKLHEAIRVSHSSLALLCTPDICAATVRAVSKHLTTCRARHTRCTCRSGRRGAGGGPLRHRAYGTSSGAAVCDNHRCQGPAGHPYADALDRGIAEECAHFGTRGARAFTQHPTSGCESFQAFDKRPSPPRQALSRTTSVWYHPRRHAQDPPFAAPQRCPRSWFW